MRNHLRNYALLLVIAAGCLGATPDPAQANSLNNWKVSCSVDRGAIRKKKKVWTFRTSANHCPGGTYNQRAEIKTDKVSPNTKGAYLFSSTVAMTTAHTEKFDIFQIHDGRDGCAPPLKVTILRSGQIELSSAVKTGPGESCISGKLSGAKSKGRILRNGTEQQLKVLIVFNGAGGFDAKVWIDDVLQISGPYRPSDRPDAFRSKHFYFKHGVYSKNVFDYVMTSRGMRVRKVKLK